MEHAAGDDGKLLPQDFNPLYSVLLLFGGMCFCLFVTIFVVFSPIIEPQVRCDCVQFVCFSFLRTVLPRGNSREAAVGCSCPNEEDAGSEGLYDQDYCVLVFSFVFSFHLYSITTCVCFILPLSILALDFNIAFTLQ